MLRRRLKKGLSAVSDETLTALWCAIDADDSDQIYPQEFGAFLRRGASDFKSKAPSNLNKKTIELGGSQTDGLGRALESTPTAEMRASLEAELTDDEMLEWAKKFCKWLEMSLYKQNLSVHSWFNLFNEVDEDGCVASALCPPPSAKRWARRSGTLAPPLTERPAGPVLAGAALSRSMVRASRGFPRRKPVVAPGPAVALLRTCATPERAAICAAAISAAASD